jgi:hypothetical protein
MPLRTFWFDSQFLAPRFEFIGFMDIDPGPACRAAITFELVSTNG